MENFSYELCYDVQNNLQISLEDLAEYTNISVSTLKIRESQGKLTKDEWHNVYRYKYLFNFALYVLETEDNARQWLKTPKKVLGDKIPLEVAKTESGAQLVIDTLGRIEHSVYA